MNRERRRAVSLENQTTVSTKIVLEHGLIFSAQSLGQLEKEQQNPLNQHTHTHVYKRIQQIPKIPYNLYIFFVMEKRKKKHYNGNEESGEIQKTKNPPME